MLLTKIKIQQLHCLLCGTQSSTRLRPLDPVHFAENEALQDSQTIAFCSPGRAQSYTRIKHHWTVFTLQSTTLCKALDHWTVVTLQGTTLCKAQRPLDCGHFAEHNAMLGSKTTGLCSLCRAQRYARLRDHWTVVTLQSRRVLPPSRRATRNTAADQGGLPGTRFSETCPLPVDCRPTTRRPLLLPPHGG